MDVKLSFLKKILDYLKSVFNRNLFFGFYSIRLRILTVLIIPLILIFVVYNYISLKIGADFTSTELQKAMENVAWRFSENLDSKLNGIIQIANLRVDELKKIDRINDIDLQNKLLIDIDQDTLIYGIGLYLNDSTKTRSKYYDRYFKKHLENVISIDGKKGRLINTDSIHTHSYIKTKNNICFSEPFIAPFADSVPLCRLSASINSASGISGNYYIDFSLSSLANIVKYKDSTIKSFGFVVVSNSGKFIYHPTSKRIARESIFDYSAGGTNPIDRQRIGLKMINGLSGVDFLRDDKNNKLKWVFFAPIVSTGWSINATIDKDEALKSMNSIYFLGYIVLIILTLLAIFSTSLVSKKLTKPITKLTFAVDQILHGNWDEHVEVSQKDEVGKLGKAFNKMKIEIRNRERDLNNLNNKLEKRVLERTKELEALSERALLLSDAANKIIDVIPIPTFVIRMSDETVIRVNRAMADFEGLDINEFNKVKMIEWFLSEEEKEKVLLSIQEKGSLLNYPLEFKRYSNGEVRNCISSFIPIKYIGEDSLVGIIIDITEIKKMQIELEKSRDIAESANKAKNEFLANISHEIRTPLNAILGFSEILSRKVSQPEHKDYLSNIITSGNTLLSMINDILDFSRIEVGKLSLNPNFTNLKKILGEIKDNYQNKIMDKDLQIILNIAEPFPDEVNIDEHRVKQILSNLLSNAIKFTEKGSIKITAASSYIDNIKENAEIFITVEDTGIGISEDNLEILFKPFVQGDGQANRKYGGTGLGLAITSRLLSLMDGILSVESKIGVGSKFCIKIPNLKVKEKNYEAEKISSSPEVSNIINNEIMKPDMVSDLSAERLDQVINILKNDLSSEWEIVSKTKAHGLIKRFVEKLKSIGSEFGLNLFIDYSKQLSNSLDSFDVSKTKNLLSQFPNLIERITTYKNNKNAGDINGKSGTEHNIGS
jgi:PAS domain S-box-containing protein